MILITLNKWLLLLLKNMGFQIKALQMLGSDASVMMKENIPGLEISRRTICVHPALIARSEGLIQAARSNQLNEYQCRALNNFLVRMIKGSPMVIGKLVKNNMDGIYQNFKNSFADANNLSLFHSESFKEMEINSCSDKEALHRLMDSDWDSNVTKITYSRKEAQSLQRSQEFQGAVNYLYGDSRNEWQSPVCTYMMN